MERAMHAAISTLQAPDQARATRMLQACALLASILGCRRNGAMGRVKPIADRLLQLQAGQNHVPCCCTPACQFYEALIPIGCAACFRDRRLGCTLHLNWGRARLTAAILGRARSPATVRGNPQGTVHMPDTSPASRCRRSHYDGSQ